MSVSVDPVSSALSAHIDSIVSADAVEAPAPDGDAPEVDGESGEDQGEDGAAEATEAPEVDDQKESGDGEEAESGDSTYGTKEDPYTIADFSANEFVRVKVDGEETVISLREALDNGIRRATLDKRAQKLSAAEKTAAQTASESRAAVQKLQEDVYGTFTDAGRARKWLVDNAPDVLVKIVLDTYPDLHKAHEEGRLEQLVQALDLKKQQRLLEAQRRQHEERANGEKSASETARRRTVFDQAMKSVMTKVGFERIPRDVVEDVANALDARETRLGRSLEPNEVEEVVQKWVTVHAPAPQNGAPNGRRRPRHRAAPRADRGAAATPRNGKGGPTVTKNEFGEFRIKL